jgi:hypothetical protein
MLVLCAAYSGASPLDCGPRVPATGFQHTHRTVLLSILRGGADRALRSPQHPQNHRAFGAAERRLHRWGAVVYIHTHTYIHTYIHSVVNSTLTLIYYIHTGSGEGGQIWPQRAEMAGERAVRKRRQRAVSYVHSDLGGCWPFSWYKYTLTYTRIAYICIRILYVYVIYTYIHAHTRTQIHPRTQRLYIYMYVCMYVCMYVYICIYVYYMYRRYTCTINGVGMPCSTRSTLR